MRFLMGFSLALATSTLCLRAETNQERLLHTCEARIAAKFKQWRFPPVTAAVAAFAKNRHQNPTVTVGDFDGNGRKDVALLIQDGSAPDPNYPNRLDSLHIAVCLDKKTGVELYFIDKLYCGDGIMRAPKGKSYYDFNTEKKGVYLFDGVSAYCFEQAGATYEFDNGAFRQIVDSD